jgi:hypothetical protein
MTEDEKKLAKSTRDAVMSLFIQIDDIIIDADPAIRLGALGIINARYPRQVGIPRPMLQETVPPANKSGQ